jgi:hypothetical protein
MQILEKILSKMSNVSKPQQKFIDDNLDAFKGTNYRNMSHYSDICEKTYSRWFRR